jgi:hypothetical protein
MNKKIHALFFLFLLNLAIVSSYPCVKFQFYEDGTNTPITNVEWRVWACGDAACTTINPSYWYQSGNSGSNNYAYIKFMPNLPPSGSYLVRMFSQNHQSKVRTWNINWASKTDPNACDQYASWNSQAIYYFTKVPNCKADFSNSVTSCAEQGLPLTILTDTNLDANTQSAFVTNNYYFPSDFSAWLTVSTRMTADVKKQGFTTSVSGYPQVQDYGIYASTTHNFNFLWQTTKNTEPGYYDITMRSTVPDTKCDQTTMIPTTNTRTVYVAQSFDGCVATVTDFATSTSNILLNQPVIFTGKKTNSYQDWNTTGTNCNTKGTLNSETFFDTSYTFTIKNTSNNQIVATKTGSLPKNSQTGVPIDFSVQWDFAKAGSYQATLVTQSTGTGIAVCNNNGLTTSAGATLQIGHGNDIDHVYDIEGDCDDNNNGG